METTKGRYLRQEHDPDDDLRNIGVTITNAPVDAAYEQAPAEAEEGEAGCGFWDRVKKPALFLALSDAIASFEYLCLMAEVIEVPGMWVCAALFGKNAG